MTGDRVPACFRLEAGGIRGRCCARGGVPFSPSLSVPFRSAPLHAQGSRIPDGSRSWGLQCVRGCLPGFVLSKFGMQAHSCLVFVCCCPCGVPQTSRLTLRCIFCLAQAPVPLFVWWTEASSCAPAVFAGEAYDPADLQVQIPPPDKCTRDSLAPPGVKPVSVFDPFLR